MIKTLEEKAMSLTALALLLLAAALHAEWNLLVKNAREKQVFTWWPLCAGADCFSPLLLLIRTFPIHIWPYILSSELIEPAYYITLTKAHHHGAFYLALSTTSG